MKHDSTRGFKCKSLQIDDKNRLTDYISELKMSLNWNDTDQKEKCRRKPGRLAEGSKAPDSRNSSVENSGTRVCVGSKPTPVRKRFENDEAEPSADKFCHTGTSIQDDSPKQKKTDSQHDWAVDSRAV